MQEILIKNGWKTQIVQILRDKCDGKFIFKGNFLSRLPNTVEQAIIVASFENFQVSGAKVFL